MVENLPEWFFDRSFDTGESPSLVSPSLSFAHTSDLGEVPSSWNSETKFVDRKKAYPLDRRRRIIFHLFVYASHKIIVNCIYLFTVTCTIISTRKVANDIQVSNHPPITHHRTQSPRGNFISIEKKGKEKKEKNDGSIDESYFNFVCIH